MKKQLSFTALLLIVLLSRTIYSQWSVDPTVNNPICTAAATQEYPAITSDGSGGAIITWDDNRDVNFNIYAQKINSSAAAQWATDGVAVCTQASNQSYAAVTSDGSGGAIITWQDSRGGSTIYAQRIDATGAPLWTTAAEGGVAISILSSWAPAIISDGSGGAIITWFYWSGTSNDIYAQRINASGVVQWTANGLAVCTQASHQYYPTITSDGSSGAIITWYDDRTGNQDIYAQRINSSGAVQWTADGVVVCTNTSRQDNPTITSDGSGGAIITWYDSRAGNNDIYAQRINSSGTAQWTANGLPVCTLTSAQFTPDISSDGSGGAIITWSDARNSTFYDIYAQRINSSGAAQWAADGIAISTVGGKAQLPVITGDASGGIITWQDSRNASGDIYASGVSLDGNIGALPVELITFSAELNGNIVELNWTTATEINNYGFEVERASVDTQDTVSPQWENIGFIQGSGTSYSPKFYEFVDNTPPFGKLKYRLRQIDLDGKFEYYNTIAQVTLNPSSANVNQIPKEFSLYQNYPNPFNPATTIRFSIASASTVTITVSNVLGQLVMYLVNDIRSEGNHKITFNANDLAAGVYLYKINAVGIDGKTNFTDTRKMILMK